MLSGRGGEQRYLDRAQDRGRGIRGVALPRNQPFLGPGAFPAYFFAALSGFHAIVGRSCFLRPTPWAGAEGRWISPEEAGRQIQPPQPAILRAGGVPATERVRHPRGGDPPASDSRGEAKSLQHVIDHAQRTERPERDTVKAHQAGLP